MITRRAKTRHEVTEQADDDEGEKQPAMPSLAGNPQHIYLLKRKINSLIENILL